MSNPFPPAKRPRVLSPADRLAHIQQHLSSDPQHPGCEVWTGDTAGEEGKVYPVMGVGRQPTERVRRFLAEYRWTKKALVGYRVGWNKACHPLCVLLDEQHIWPELAPGFSTD